MTKKRTSQPLVVEEVSVIVRSWLWKEDFPREGGPITIAAAHYRGGSVVLLWLLPHSDVLLKINRYPKDLKPGRETKALWLQIAKQIADGEVEGVWSVFGVAIQTMTFE